MHDTFQDYCFGIRLVFGYSISQRQSTQRSTGTSKSAYNFLRHRADSIFTYLLTYLLTYLRTQTHTHYQKHNLVRGCNYVIIKCVCVCGASGVSADGTSHSDKARVSVVAALPARQLQHRKQSQRNCATVSQHG